MVTIHREAGFSFIVFSNDHEPAHVHVRGDGTAKINLVGRNGRPELVHVVGMTKADTRHALRLVTERQEEFLSRWKAMHG